MRARLALIVGARTTHRTSHCHELHSAEGRRYPRYSYAPGLLSDESGAWETI